VTFTLSLHDALPISIDGALDTGITPVMWEGSEEDLTLTHNAQPAILAHSAAVLAVLRPALGSEVVAAAGHSLGEYSAWLAAGGRDRKSTRLNSSHVK